MAEFNLLKTAPKAVRDVGARLIDKEKNREISMQFGYEYFDGPREQGYGGYTYDGRWIAVAKEAIARYGLKSGSLILDIGCAKGFLVHDMMDVCPGLQAYGLDVSDYAVLNCHPDVVGRLHKGDAARLPFPDDSFDAVFSINTAHNLDRADCIVALQEMSRVAKKSENCFVQVDAYRSPEEKQLFEDWMLSAKTYCRPEEWVELFWEAGYRGDYFWTILEFDPDYTVINAKEDGISE